VLLLRRLLNCAGGLLTAAIGLAAHGAAFAQASASAPSASDAQTQLRRLYDPYYPEVLREVAGALLAAAPGRWSGVLVNEAPRRGWLNLYLIDADRLGNDEYLQLGDVELSREALAGGALADEASDSIYLNTAAWKRMAAAAMLDRLEVVDGTVAGLAAVDAYGLTETRRFWDRGAYEADTDAARQAGWFMQGALAFVLAHEIGHLQIGRSQAAEAADARLKDLRKLSEREKDERMACPETLPGEYRTRQQHEMAADLAAVKLLGQQCRIGEDGELRHQIYLLGTNWYFLVAMGDKLLQMGRSSDSRFIATALQQLIGPQLYAQAVAGARAEVRKGGVKVAFPKTHPPDYARAEAISRAFKGTPCGGNDLDASGIRMMEMLRESVCAKFASGAGGP
jgi:hypothetical protein